MKDPQMSKGMYIANSMKLFNIHQTDSDFFFQNDAFENSLAVLKKFKQFPYDLMILT